MRALFICFAAGVITFTSCSTTQKTTPTTSGTTTTTSSREDRDGSSYEKAIVVKEKTEGQGVRAEYDWIKKHYTDYTVKGQSLNFKGKTPYDIITIILADGKEVMIYFNITNYFGKF